MNPTINPCGLRHRRRDYRHRRDHPRRLGQGSRAAITPDSLLLEDLALDSLDLVAVVIQLQDQFQVEIDPDEITAIGPSATSPPACIATSARPPETRPDRTDPTSANSVDRQAILGTRPSRPSVAPRFDRGKGHDRSSHLALAPLESGMPAAGRAGRTWAHRDRMAKAVGRREPTTSRLPPKAATVRSMNPWLPVRWRCLLLLIPGLLLRARSPGRAVSPPMPEIRGPLRWLHRVFRVYCTLWHELRTEGCAPLPESGPAILIANHTCGIDHMLLQAASRRLLGFMIAREYYESRWLHWICSYIGCIPVNRDGRDLAAIRAACGRSARAASCRSSRRAGSCPPRGDGSARCGRAAPTSRSVPGCRSCRPTSSAPRRPTRSSSRWRCLRRRGSSSASRSTSRTSRRIGPATRPCRPRSARFQGALLALQALALAAEDGTGMNRSA